MVKNKRTNKADKASKEKVTNEDAGRPRESKARAIETAAEKGTAKKKDFPTVRSNIAILVADSAEVIVAKVIEAAKSGQLAPAKYLFEAVGLYPPIEETEEPEDESLAFTLLQRMGVTAKPINYEEDPPEGLPGFASHQENERDGKATGPTQEGCDQGDDSGDAVK